MATLNEIITVICQAAGWSPREAGPSGSVSFALADGSLFEILKPDDWTLFFRADLGVRPEDETGADELARRLGALAAGAFSIRRSTLALADGRFRLHRRVDLRETALEGLPDICADFLNDLDWWRANYPAQDSPPQGAFPPEGLRL